MIASIIAAAVACLAGAGVYAWFQRALRSKATKAPKEWPLIPRLLVNSKERKVWVWLAKAMHDQQIMVKLPVTCFTLPIRREEAQHWYRLLNRVYCTFTICNFDGRVIGCVDVPGGAGLSNSKQTLKYGLLSQCGIPYWVVEPDNLPHMSQIRTAFLGDGAALQSERDHRDARGLDLGIEWHTATTPQYPRKAKAQPEQAAKPGMHGVDVAELQGDWPLTNGWDQNSFIAELDSRAGDI